jgi:hypothetical protein
MHKENIVKVVFYFTDFENVSISMRLLQVKCLKEMKEMKMA